MKVILAVTGSESAENITDALRERGLRVTMMASKGGFLRESNATLLIGVRDEQVDEVLNVIAESATPMRDWPRLLSSKDRESRARATVFVLNMSRFEQYQR